LALPQSSLPRLVRVTPIGLQAEAEAEAQPFWRRHDGGRVVAQANRFVMAGSEIELLPRQVGHGVLVRPRDSTLLSARGRPLWALVQVVAKTVQWMMAQPIQPALCRCRLEEVLTLPEECYGTMPVADELSIQRE